VPFDSCADRVQQAQVSFERRAFQKAAQEFAEALKLCPQRDTILISLGQTQFLAGDEVAAEQTLLQAINQTAARYALGRIYYQQGRYVEAASQLEKVTALEPENFRAHDNLALCYDALQRDSDALRHFFRALDLVKDAHREYDWAYANLAEFFLKREQFDKAFPLAVEAAERNPNAARNFFLAGQTLVKLGQFQNSLQWLRRAVELEPGHAEAHFQLAQALRRLGQTE
jgi:tetratricopeptide (TPR) repeat protein